MNKGCIPESRTRRNLREIDNKAISLAPLPTIISEIMKVSYKRTDSYNKKITDIINTISLHPESLCFSTMITVRYVKRERWNPEAQWFWVFAYHRQDKLKATFFNWQLFLIESQLIQKTTRLPQFSNACLSACILYQWTSHSFLAPPSPKVTQIGLQSIIFLASCCRSN
jgi:hypothetical protein